MPARSNLKLAAKDPVDEIVRDHAAVAGGGGLFEEGIQLLACPGRVQETQEATQVLRADGARGPHPGLQRGLEGLLHLGELRGLRRRNAKLLEVRLELQALRGRGRKGEAGSGQGHVLRCLEAIAGLDRLAQPRGTQRCRVPFEGVGLKNQLVWHLHENLVLALSWHDHDPQVRRPLEALCQAHPLRVIAAADIEGHELHALQRVLEAQLQAAAQLFGHFPGSNRLHARLPAPHRDKVVVTHRELRHPLPEGAAQLGGTTGLGLTEGPQVVCRRQPRPDNRVACVLEAVLRLVQHLHVAPVHGAHGAAGHQHGQQPAFGRPQQPLRELCGRPREGCGRACSQPLQVSCEG
mmetsp:Transcript_103294/g.287510  ORF Transcript_103294/g.287510 Transcript_103294/m.287510 type:complete len:350 (-) Transcript_103294:78-1127(-)